MLGIEAAGLLVTLPQSTQLRKSIMQQHRAILGSIITCAIVGVLEPPAQSLLAVANTPSSATVKLAQGSTRIQGGTELTIRLKPTAEHPKITSTDLAAVRKTIANRLDGLGMSNAIVQSFGGDRLSVKLPGISDPQIAARVIGSTARLEFRQQKIGSESKLSAALARLTELKANQSKLEASGNRQAIAKNLAELQAQAQEIGKLFDRPTISGKNISTAQSQPLSDNGWEIAIAFDKSGGDAFAKLTKDLAGTGRSVGIFLDDDPISMPFVDAQFAATGIIGGKAVIQGNFTQKTATYLAIQLRSGALPVPIEIIASQKYIN
jgi:preprotein translocase subunit SecD